MEAWILHIEETCQDEYGKLIPKHSYSAWSTEKQAYKNAANFLKEQADLIFSGAFRSHSSLKSAIVILIDSEKILEAINLVNDYSVSTKNTMNQAGSNKVQIKIVKSKFLGSVFE